MQEEPSVWLHVKERLDFGLKQIGRSIEFGGRKENAVPAPGIGKMYGEQQKIVVDSAFKGLWSCVGGDRIFRELLLCGRVCAVNRRHHLASRM